MRAKRNFTSIHVLVKNVKVGPQMMILAECILQPTGGPVMSFLPEEKHYNGLNKLSRIEVDVMVKNRIGMNM